MSRSNKIFLFIVFAFIVFFLLGGKNVFHSLPGNKKDFQYLSLFSEVVAGIKSDYFEEIRPADKFSGAYTGMLGSLDRLSTYLDRDETDIYRIYHQGILYGPGIYGTKRGNYFYITDVLKDSPAEKAGLLPGDIVKSAHAHSLFSLPFFRMYLSLLSKKDEKISLVIEKRSTRETKKIELDSMRLESICTVSNPTPGTLLVELPRFDARAADYLKKALANRKPSKLILDLRKYSGGDLPAFLELSKLFFDEGTPALTLETKRGREKILFGAPGAPLSKCNTVVIVNRSTIMYGELLVALLTESPGERKITLVGKNTPGLISQVKFFELGDGSSLLLSEGFFFLGDKQLGKSGLSPHIQIKNKDFGRIIEKCNTLLKND